MKNSMIYALAIVVLAGCSGHQSAGLKINENSISFNQIIIGLMPPEGSSSLSKAYVRMKEIDAKTGKVHRAEAQDDSSTVELVEVVVDDKK